MSTSWLRCLPGANGLSTAQFGEALTTFLCSPSPSCIDRVGEKIGKTRVDLFGDRLCIESNLVGGHQTRRHDYIKLEVNNLCVWAGLQAECEPYGMFSDLIPQQPHNRIDARRRARQVIRPDFKFTVSSRNGIPESRVADVKTVSCGAPSWYKPGVRAVKRRAVLVQGEYAKDARDMDIELGVDVDNIQGPVTRRLQEFSPVIPLVFGGFCEVSEEVHNLIDILASH